MEVSENSCKTGIDALMRFVNLRNQEYGVFQNENPENVEKCANALEVLEKAFENRPDVIIHSESSDNSVSFGDGNFVIPSTYGYASFEIEDRDSMRLALEFLQNVDSLMIGADVDPATGKTYLIMEWRIDDVRF